MSQTFARLGHTITTAYTTLGEEGLQLSWEEPEVELCFCGEAQLGMVARVLGKVERVKYVVYEETVRTDSVRHLSAMMESLAPSAAGSRQTALKG
jgi:long-chain acyl-CoA synthetase